MRVSEVMRVEGTKGDNGSLGSDTAVIELRLLYDVR